MDAFRAEAAKAPLDFVACDEPDALDAAAADGPRKVTVLALVDRFFEEDDGSRTVLLRGGDKKRSIRVRIAPEERKAMEAVNLEGTKEEFTQNYLRVSGTLQKGRRGYDLVGVEPADWQPAGPAPGR